MKNYPKYCDNCVKKVGCILLKKNNYLDCPIRGEIRADTLNIEMLDDE